MREWAICGATMCLILLAASGVSPASDGKLVIFHAGSLAVPFREVSAVFHKRHPGIVVEAEAAGSLDSARKITELGRPCDVFGSADDEIVRSLLEPTYTDYSISFATNELGLAYTDKSRLGDKINHRNWCSILLDPRVSFGRADPDRDPCGYRTVMAFQLAEKYYRVPGLAKKLLAKGGRRFIRPKETDLLALLEAGEIDYLFIYRSVIKQHKLKMLRLPAKINLGSPKLASYYKQASIVTVGKTPGEKIKINGAPIVYAATIPKNVENRKLAEQWLSLLLSAEGARIMENNGQSAIRPARVDHFGKLPTSLKRFCKQEPAR